MKLKQARERSGKSQMTVALEVELTLSSYRKIEYGGTRRPHIGNVYGIANSVGMDPHDIDEFADVLAEYETVTGLSEAATSTAQQGGDEAERFYSRERFEAAVEAEVERRLAVASQSMGIERVAAQGGDEVTQT